MSARLALIASLGACISRGGQDSTTPKPKSELDRSFGGFAARLKQDDALGKIPANLDARSRQLAENMASTADRMVSHIMAFESVADGRVCFTDKRSDVKASFSADAYGKGVLRDPEVWIEALDDLDVVAKRPLLPSPGGKLDTMEIVSDEIADKDTDDGIRRVRTILFRFCGPAPAITPQTRYLAAVIHSNQSIDYGGEPLPVDGLILWEIER